LGCICSKKYTLDNLPEDDVLVADLKEMLKIYDQYFELHKNEYSSVKKAPTKGKKGAAQLNTTDGTGVVDKGLF